MRPDEYKAKQSRKYQARKKNRGDDTAAVVAEERRKAAKARDNGNSIAAIRRRNGELPSLQQQRETNGAIIQARSSRFSRRKIVSNRDRYEEMSAQERLEQDAELGIDRETTDLVEMLEKTDETGSGSTYFKFKEEQLDQRQKDQDSLFQVNFDLYESVLSMAADTRAILDLSEEDTELIDAAFDNQPMMPHKPLVPAFVKSGRGVVLFKQAEKREQNEMDGIYIRNEPVKRNVEVERPELNDDDLDELLALVDEKKQEPAPAAASSSSVSSSNRAKPPQLAPPNSPKSQLPRPGTILKKPQTIQKSSTKLAAEDEAWLDDILG
ncbi:hypothetical protein BX666DRAFT_2022975 [Dichotomocladium elegans]|nr:hypothetical protein BX666DRAFT_2022975 [Dichotomocladium elegans]